MLQTLNIFISGYIPHGHCYLWQPSLIWLHIISDLLTAVSYYLISGLLIYFTRSRRDLPFPYIFLLFGGFIVACGTVHLLEVVTVWQPYYWLSGSVKALTATISIFTALLSIKLIPKALKLPSPNQLAAANQELAEEILEHQQTQATLKESERRFRAIFNSTFQFIGLLTPTGILLEANQTALDFAGIESEAIIDRPFWEARWWTEAGQNPGELTPKQQQLQKAIARAAAGKFVRYQVDVRGAGDILTTIDFSLKPILDENNQVVLIIPEGRDISILQQAEEQLRLSETKFRSAFETAAIGKCLVSPEGQFLEVNPSLCRLLGYYAAELLTLTFPEITYPPDLETDLEQLQKLLAGEISAYNLEKRYFHKDGHIIWALLSVTLVRNSRKEPLYFIAQIQDISDRHQAELALRESEARFRLMADSAPVLLWMSDSQGSRIFFNRPWLEFTGCSLEQQIGDGWLAQVHPEDRREYLETYQSALATQTSFQTEYRLRRADGEYRWVFATGVPRSPDDATQPTIFNNFYGSIGYVGSAVDITPLKETQSALEHSQSLLAGVLNSSLDGVTAFRSIRDHQGKIVDFEYLLVNATAEKIIGRSEAELVGKSLLTELPGHVESGLFEMYAEVTDTGIPQEQEFHYHYDKIEGWFQTVVVKLGDGFAVTFREISDRKRYEVEREKLITELQRSNRELQDFAFIASHDLQEPLRKIQAFGSRLQKKYGETLNPQAEDYLKRMVNAGQRMQVLIEDLLTFSRLTTRIRPFEPIELNSIITEVLSDLEATIEQTKSKVEVGNLPTIEADSLQMRQLFQNLIANALKFQEPNTLPLVKIYSVSPPNEETLKFVVEDNGIGFEEKYLERIFSPFQRLHSRSEYPGTGMGLAICRKIVELHQGKITAQSSLGEGSKFIVTLPLQRRATA
ncbi:MAG: PAS domain S-box protein [Oscillatoria sp. PMC 1068.18]|nr:PAS domain S-box protein [Oscillatoria sp. PMC 1076.18]MEC4989642.1 PAS domain S-box protein [Oscillatoria sp. PMC 1068.18]